MADATERVRCAASGCAHVMCMPAETVERLRETHGDFYCPMGHPNHFPGKTKEESKIEELQNKVSRLEKRIDSEQRRAEHFRDLFHAEINKWSTCPVEWCPKRTYRYSSPHTLFQHLEKAHNLSMQWEEPKELAATTGE